MEIVNIALATFAAALIAQVTMPGTPPLGIGLTAVFGFAALLIATAVGREFGWYEAGEIAGFVGTLVSAIGLLAVHRIFHPGERRVRRSRFPGSAAEHGDAAANDAFGASRRSLEARD